MSYDPSEEIKIYEANYQACVAVATNNINKHKKENVQNCGDGLDNFNCIGCPFKPLVCDKHGTKN